MTSSRPLTSDFVAAIDLDETGWLLDEDTGEPVAEHHLARYFAERLAPPSWATDIIVYVHGWQTSPRSAARAANRLRDLSEHAFITSPNRYPRLAEGGFRPWMLAVRWPSSSRVGRSGYEQIRERAHAMGARHGTGYAAHVIGRLLGYLDAERPNPAGAQVLANREGQWLHLVGHSFGCRFLGEAVQWAAEASLGDTLSWTVAEELPSRPFTADSMLLFQMAAPRSAFGSLFPSLLPGGDGGHDGAPLRGPVVTTYSRHDRATGFWHLRAEGERGIGHSGMASVPLEPYRIRMRRAVERYPFDNLNHRFVSIDASDFYVRGKRLNPAGAHSDHLRLESAHLLLSLADWSR
ncbi:hypothetical protein AS594_36340 [Streptomyces agglomeratus]|uniref:Alpha/beta hydrolase n=1 Tax=Streptomyces agglomeratus TaxID=285458 RepID=A0A1E5PHM7_9ACTN|nr:hypothetical protein [Streptomyces agglomeratus]OEJ29070.1 hypothetical protein AS594_36340 [Streptomyces agglomeratus]